MTLETALQLHQSGKLAEAETAYRQLLAQNDQNPQANYLLGVVLMQSQREAQALPFLQTATALAPSEATYHSTLGEVLRMLGQLEDSLRAGAMAIQLAPELMVLRFNYALALIEADRFPEAKAQLQRVLSAQPAFVEALKSYAFILRKEGRLEAAAAVLRKAIELRPNHLPAIAELGLVLVMSKQFDEARHWCEEYFKIGGVSGPKDLNAGVFLNLALSQASLGKRAEALAAFAAAIEQKPDLVEAHVALANLLLAERFIDLGVQSLQTALKINPRFARAYVTLGTANRSMGNTAQALAHFRKALEIDPNDREARDALCHSLYFDDQTTPETILSEHRKWAMPAVRPDKFQPPAVKRSRIRIGYVSPDFRNHVVGRNMLPLYRHHDRDAFEIFSYSGVDRPDSFTDIFRQQSDRWRNISRVSDADVLDFIRRDEVDILVDLTLHLVGNRLPVFAARAAAAQVTFAGYPGTTGVPAMDFRLSDPYLDPPGPDVNGNVRDSLYSEKTLRLPHSFWCYQPDEKDPPVAPLPALASKIITFGCLNYLGKVTPTTIALWRRIFEALPNSRLVLMTPRGKHREDVIQRLHLDSTRVRFVTTAHRDKYLARFNKIDIALDPYPYNGHTSSLDAMFMGVPVVSLYGKSVASRAGLSQLTNLGLPELATDQPDQYIQIALRLARDLGRLAQLRQELRPRMQASPLMDAAGFTRAIERIFHKLVAGEP